MHLILPVSLFFLLYDFTTLCGKCVTEKRTKIKRSYSSTYAAGFPYKRITFLIKLNKTCLFCVGINSAVASNLITFDREEIKVWAKNKFFGIKTTKTKLLKNTCTSLGNMRVKNKGRLDFCTWFLQSWLFFFQIRKENRKETETQIPWLLEATSNTMLMQQSL